MKEIDDIKKQTNTINITMALTVIVLIGGIIAGFMLLDESLDNKIADVSCISGGVVVAFQDARIIEADPEKHTIQIETKEGHEFWWWGDTLIEVKP